VEAARRAPRLQPRTAGAIDHATRVHRAGCEARLDLRLGRSVALLEVRPGWKGPGPAFSYMGAVLGCALARAGPFKDEASRQ
jgi:hypothetical protein